MSLFHKLLKSQLYSYVKKTHQMILLVCVVIFLLMRILDIPLTPDQMTIHSEKKVFQCFGLVCIQTVGFEVMNYSNFSAFEDLQTTISFDEDTVKYTEFLWTGYQYLFFSSCIFAVTSSIWNKVKNDQVEEFRECGERMSVFVLRRMLISLMKKRNLTQFPTLVSMGLLYWWFEVAGLAVVTTVFYRLVVEIPDTYTAFGYSSILQYKMSDNSNITVNGTDLLFPAVTKCWVNVTQQSGSSDILEAMCSHYLNTANKVVYYFLLFWFLAVFLVCVVAFVFHCVFLMTRVLRLAVFMSLVPVTPFQAYFLRKWSGFEIFGLYQMREDLDTRLIDVIILYIYKVFYDWL